MPSERLDLWSVFLDGRRDDMPARLELLSPAERVRASRYESPRDQARFVVARSTLRSVLAQYVGRGAESLRFEAGPFGKPYLQDAGGLRFNVSHSGPLAAIAVSHHRDVGIDIELVRPEGVELSEEVFTCDERRCIEQAGEPFGAFYSHWTMKEAHLKARGLGLHLPPSQVAVRPGRRHQSAGFATIEWDMAPGFAAAVALECAPDEAFPPLRCRTWTV